MSREVERLYLKSAAARGDVEALLKIHNARLTPDGNEFREPALTEHAGWHIRKRGQMRRVWRPTMPRFDGGQEINVSAYYKPRDEMFFITDTGEAIHELRLRMGMNINDETQLANETFYTVRSRRMLYLSAAGYLWVEAYEAGLADAICRMTLCVHELIGLAFGEEVTER